MIRNRLYLFLNHGGHKCHHSTKTVLKPWQARQPRNHKIDVPLSNSPVQISCKSTLNFLGILIVLDSNHASQRQKRHDVLLLKNVMKCWLGFVVILSSGMTSVNVS